MKKFSIPEPCSEKWNEMTPTEKGAFCDKCSHEVNDVTSMSNAQIRDLLLKNEGKRTCVRISSHQQDSLNEDFRIIDLSKKQHMQRAMLFSLLVVFGFTLFSCTSPEQISELHQLQKAALTFNSTEAKETEPTVTNESVVTEENDSIEPIKEVVHPMEKPELELYMLGEPILYEQQVDSIETTCVRVEHITMGMMISEPLRIEPELKEIVHHDRTVSNLPKEFAALAYPNPVADQTTLKVELPEKSDILRIWLLDMNGRKLQSICEQKMEAGVHEFPVAMTNLNPGTYLASIQYNNKSEVVRIVKVN